MVDATTHHESSPLSRLAVQASSRRKFLAVSGAAAVLAFTTRLPSSASTAGGVDSALDYPFTLGVASGDPLPDAVVIWTRLAPEPLDSRGGMPYRDRRVRWEVATDERFRHVVRRGTATARPTYAHSVHVDVRGLEPDRVYYYRFREGRHVSPVGRTKTAPAAGAHLQKLSFAYVSCQHYAHGHYTAYQHLVDEDLDVVVHLGDYIYESRLQGEIGRGHVPDQFLFTLDDYRVRHALYKTDENLQRAHATFPFIITWDDHAVANNYANDIGPGDSEPSEDFIVRRANGYRAYWEHLPLRVPEPDGPDMRLYRRFAYGDLAELSVVDNRQYRSDQSCNGCDDQDDPSRVFLGHEQREWLLDGMGQSTTTWNVIAQQQLMAKGDRDPGEGERLPMDSWSGYEPARQRLFDGIAERDIDNVVVLSGDSHCNLVADLKLDFDDQSSPTIGSEFLGTSVTSGGGGYRNADGADMDTRGEQWLAANPHIRYYNQRRGYTRCTVTPDEWRTDYRIMPYVREPDAPISTGASFVVQDGVPGVEQV